MSGRKTPMQIQCGVLRRSIKELAMYRKELVTQSARIEGLRACTPVDEHMVKKQIEVLDETKDIIPDCLARLQKSLLTVEQLLSEASDADSPECDEGNALLVEAAAILEAETA